MGEISARKQFSLCACPFVATSSIFKTVGRRRHVCDPILLGPRNFSFSPAHFSTVRWREEGGRPDGLSLPQRSSTVS